MAEIGKSRHMKHVLSIHRSKTAKIGFIKGKRGSAKHSVNDDHAFLWEHAIFRYLPSRNPITDQDQILHD